MSRPEPPPIQKLLAAAQFAAQKHRNQRRKTIDLAPYINHPITVADLLARVGSVTDVAILQAALLHDTIEDTETTPADLEQHFGSEVRDLVEEVSDNRQLPKAERKRLQIEHAPHLSPGAALIKLADKIANITDITDTEPVGWPPGRKREYLLWAKEVVDRLPVRSEPLQLLFKRTFEEKQILLASSAAPTNHDPR
jgi:guanosine-3',5'-bis(diphosphate) 3'-pyrophosphohydrolase